MGSDMHLNPPQPIYKTTPNLTKRDALALIETEMGKGYVIKVERNASKRYSVSVHKHEWW